MAAIERSGEAGLRANEGDRIALTHSLVAATVRLWVALSVAERRLLLANEVMESRRETLRLVNRRYQRGLQDVSAVDVRLARENLASAEASLPSFELDRIQARHALDELVGRKPGSGGSLAGRAAELPPLQSPPLGLPAGLLDRRPDLAAAAFRTEAAAAEVDVALSARYPDLVLSAAGGWDADTFGELFDAETLFANLAADLVAPLFASGRLEADVDTARARLEAQAALYAATVLGALREVEDAWVAERLLREQLAFVELQRDEARIAEQLARDRYGRGLQSLLTVLETERRRASAEDLALQLQSAVWNARTDLHLALGGDWFADPNDPPSESSSDRGPRS